MILAAAQLVVKGSVFSLNAPLDFFDPPLFGRSSISQDVQPIEENWGLNEVINDFNPQLSSQWDGLSHVSYRPDEFYNGASLKMILETGRNTTAHWAKRGIVGRGVLLDLPRSANMTGRSFDPGTSYELNIPPKSEGRLAPRHSADQSMPSSW